MRNEEEIISKPRSKKAKGKRASDKQESSGSRSLTYDD